MKAIVEIVFDSKKKKLRVKPVGRTGWVRFPNELRTEVGAMYEVQNLKKGSAGSWVATGDIVPVLSMNYAKALKKAA